MKAFGLFILTILFSMYIVNVMAWSRGNSMEWTYKEEVLADASHAEKPDSGKDYYWKRSLMKTVKPSSIPGFFTREVDTLSVKFTSRNK